jgi:small subunit ribosomal protein S5e
MDRDTQDYIAVKPKYAQFVPHTAGRFQAKRFKKAQCPIVERLTNSIMMHGRNNGKKIMAVRIVKHAFEIVNLLTDENPIQQLVNAVINASPREDSTRIGSGVLQGSSAIMGMFPVVFMDMVSVVSSSMVKACSTSRTVSEIFILVFLLCRWCCAAASRRRFTDAPCQSGSTI